MRTNRLIATMGITLTAYCGIPTAEAFDRSDIEKVREIQAGLADQGEAILDANANTDFEADVMHTLDSYGQGRVERDAERMLRAYGTADERQVAKDIASGYDKAKIKRDVMEILDNHGEFIEFISDSDILDRKQRSQLRSLLRKAKSL